MARRGFLSDASIMSKYPEYFTPPAGKTSGLFPVGDDPRLVPQRPKNPEKLFQMKSKKSGIPVNQYRQAYRRALRTLDNERVHVIDPPKIGRPQVHPLVNPVMGSRPIVVTQQQMNTQSQPPQQVRPLDAQALAKVQSFYRRTTPYNQQQIYADLDAQVQQLGLPGIHANLTQDRVQNSRAFGRLMNMALLRDTDLPTRVVQPFLPQPVGAPPGPRGRGTGRGGGPPPPPPPPPPGPPGPPPLGQNWPPLGGP